MLNFTMKSLVMKDPSWYRVPYIIQSHRGAGHVLAYQNDSLSVNSIRYTVRQFLKISFPVSAAYRLSIHIFQHVLIFCFSSLKTLQPPSFVLYSLP